MPDIMPTLRDVEARMYFYNLIHEHLNKGLNYHDFWLSKEKGLLKIDKIIKQIYHRYYTERDIATLQAGQEFNEFQDKEVKKISTNKSFFILKNW